MPLFRLIDPPPHLEDATFAYDENPDSKLYEEVGPSAFDPPANEEAAMPPVPSTALAPEPAESPTAAPTEETE